MSLACGLIGLPFSGKTTIFNAITSAGVSSFDGSEMNRAVVYMPDSRLDRLEDMYHPQKNLPPTLEVVDIPGIKPNPQRNDRSSRLLGHIKDVDALVHVVRCFEDSSTPFEYDTINPARDVETVDIELMVADASTLENKIVRLEKRVRAGDKDAVKESEHCAKVKTAIEEGVPARKQELTEKEIESIWECNLVSMKPVLYVANIKSIDEIDNKHVKALQEIAAAEGAEVVTICGRDEAEISQLEAGDREEFLAELGLEESSLERLITSAFRVLGLINFFTVGEDECRAWTCRKNDKAPVAAGKIHTDMEKGFIRMEVFTYADLMELGSEAAVAKAGRQRLEGKDYIVKDGDIVTVRFNASK